MGSFDWGSLIGGIILLAIVAGLSVLAWLASKYLSKGLYVAQYPIRALCDPIREPVKTWFQGLWQAIAQKLGINFRSSRGKWGSLGMVWFIIFSAVFGLVRVTVGIIVDGGMETAEYLANYTALGGLIGLIDSFGSGDNVFTAQSAITVFFVGLGTDYFMQLCHKQRLPIGVQILYDAVFILFIASLRSLIPDGLFNSLPNHWWQILNLPFVDMLNGITPPNTWALHLLTILRLFLQTLNIFLSMVTIYVVALFFLSAVKQLMSAMVCSVTALIVLFLITSLWPLVFDGAEVPTAVNLILVILAILGAGLASLHIDFLAKLLRGYSRDVEPPTIHLQNYKPVYNGLTLFIAGFFGSPFLYMLLGLILSAISSDDAALTPVQLVVFALILLGIFVGTCVPGILLICKREDEDQIFRTSMTFIKKAAIYFPCIVIGLVGSIVWVIFRLAKHPLNRKPWMLALNVMFEDPEDALILITAKFE